MKIKMHFHIIYVAQFISFKSNIAFHERKNLGYILTMIVLSITDVFFLTNHKMMYIFDVAN